MTSSPQALPRGPLMYQKLVDYTCVCCLTKTGSLIPLGTCNHVEFLRVVSEIACNYNDKFVCNYCHNLLKKFLLFRQQVKENVTAVLNKVVNVQVNNKVSKLTRRPSEHVNINDFEKHNSVEGNDPIKLEIEIEPEPFNDICVKEEYHSASDNEVETQVSDVKHEQGKETISNVFKTTYKEDNIKRPDKDVLLKTLQGNETTEVVVPTQDKPKVKTCEQVTVPVLFDKYAGKVKLVKLTEEQMLEERAKEKNKTEHLAFKCKFCYSGFNHEVSYKEHMEQRHYESPNVCRICKNSFKKERVLSIHYTGHYRKYECLACGARYSTIRSAYDHYTTTHKRLGENFRCLHCDFVTDNHRQFRYHREQHKSLDCKYCGKTFKSKISFKNHVLVVHENQKHGKHYVCKDCGKSYSHLSYYNQHIKKQHSGGPKLYCAECDVEFTSELTLRCHLKNSRKHKPADLNFVCDYCNRKFDRKFELRVHINFEHLKLINNICSICNKNFMREGQLIRHVEFVHKKKQVPRSHICDHCGKGFTVRRVLDSHIRTHTGERPYKCSNCPATFAHSGARYTHNKLVHKVRGGTATVGEKD